MNVDLDPDFLPSALWNRRYAEDARAHPAALPATLGLLRGDKPLARRELLLLPDAEDRSFRYLERILKTLLWIHGGERILFSGPARLCERLREHYAHSPTGRFDSELIGLRICGAPLHFSSARPQDIPAPSPASQRIGRHLDGCRIGFDLGGSDRKAAALIDGKLVFSEEIPWDPYFQRDPSYHYQGIMDSLRRAAAHLPRVDAIGGSAAGVYVDNQVRVASLFRGVSPADFDTQVRPLFTRIRAEWGNLPFKVLNDGEVTALAAAMSLNVNGILGVSMGTSTAAGYVTPEGSLTPWINELAFVPIDHREKGPVDEWSGDRGCGVQYFSQQAVARLAPLAGISLPGDMPLAERLVEVQRLMAAGDPQAHRIYHTIGNAFGHALALWSESYDFRHVLILGRVTSGSGGDLILAQARAVLQRVYPDLASQLSFHIPDEHMKRHGQAVAAASLPEIPRHASRP